MNRSILQFGLVALLGLAQSALCLAGSKTDDAIRERIQPIGKLCMQGEPCASGGLTVASAARTTEEIYKTKCFACHGTGAAGAPKMGVAADWAARLAKGKETLYKNSINGVNAMPPKGLCMDCSDDELKAVVDYMLDNSK